MEGDASQGRQLCPKPEKMSSQKLEGSVDISCTQVYRGIQSLPPHKSCKRGRACHPQPNLGSCPILKPDSWGPPEREKELTFTVLHTCSVPRASTPGSPESLFRVEQMAAPPRQVFPPPPIPHSRLPRCMKGYTCVQSPWVRDLSCLRRSVVICSQIYGL